METPTLTRQDIPTQPQASSAWIAPNGDFYYVRPCNHSYVAEELLGTHEDALFARGWVKVSSVDIYASRDASQAQLDTIWQMVEAYPIGHRRNALFAEYRDVLNGTQ